MKALKQHIPVLLAVLALGAALPVTGYGAGPEPVPMEAEEAEAAVQEQANAAYQALLESFEVDGDAMDYIYPPEYAGAWVEDDILHVALTTREESVLTRYTQIMNQPEHVRFELREQPLAWMYAYQDAAFRLLVESEGCRAFAAYTDLQRGAVVLEVARDDIPAAWALLHSGLTAADFFGTGAPVPHIDSIFEVIPGEPITLDDLGVDDQPQNDLDMAP